MSKPFLVLLLLLLGFNGLAQKVFLEGDAKWLMVNMALFLNDFNPFQGFTISGDHSDIQSGI